MRIFASAMVVVFVCFVLSGCHSGTVRGVGSDVERLGHKMEK